MNSTLNTHVHLCTCPHRLTHYTNTRTHAHTHTHRRTGIYTGIHTDTDRQTDTLVKSKGFHLKLSACLKFIT